MMISVVARRPAAIAPPNNDHAKTPPSPREAAREQANVQLVLGLRHLLRENLREFVISAGTAALAAVREGQLLILVLKGAGTAMTSSI